MDGRDDLVVNENLVIPAAELQWRFSASGGPGGQHANTSNTRAEVVFDAAESAVLSPSDKQRIIERIGPRVTVAVDDTRSQKRNRDLALSRLAAKLRSALHRPKSRRPTRPGRGAKERRLQEKRHRSQRKAERRSRPDFD